MNDEEQQKTSLASVKVSEIMFALQRFAMFIQTQMQIEKQLLQNRMKNTSDNRKWTTITQPFQVSNDSHMSAHILDTVTNIISKFNFDNHHYNNLRASGSTFDAANVYISFELPLVICFMAALALTPLLFDNILTVHRLNEGEKVSKKTIL